MAKATAGSERSVLWKTSTFDRELNAGGRRISINGVTSLVIRGPSYVSTTPDGLSNVTSQKYSLLSNNLLRRFNQLF